MRRKNFTRWMWALVGLMLVSQSLLKAAQASQDNFTIIVLPDTQFYSRSYPDIYADQTQWIVDNKDALNIVYVAHEGDIVDDWDQEYQWVNAEAAMKLLEDPVTTGLPGGIPYGVLPGGHDQPTTLYNKYFGVNRFQGRSYYGGHYPPGSNDSNFVLFSAAGMDFIVINIEGYPKSDVRDWADARLKEYSDRRAIVVSHYLINTGGSFGSPGQAIYDALKDNANLFLMLCGHAHGEAMRLEEYSGNAVHILLANYQELPNGGNGWFRIMEFSPASDEIMVRTYSPTLDQYGTDTVMGDNTTSQEFAISYDYAPPPVLLYTPVTPCRIVDTRKAGGAIPPGSIRSYNVYGDVTSQGGNPAGCPSPKGEPSAVALNVTAVPLGNGNIVAYPFSSAVPTASLVNYRSDAQNIANSGTVKTCFNCSKDINIKSNYGTAHVVIDVLGYYYAKP